MSTTNEPAPPETEELPVLQAARGLPGPKDGTGIGDLADRGTVTEWVNAFLTGRDEVDPTPLATAFRFGVAAESRYAGQSFVEAEPELGLPLEGAEDYLRVEVAYAASHEGARHLDDVLARRTRISIEAWDRGVGAAPAAAAIMAPVLRWTDDQTRREVELYRERVAAERASQTLPDDESADAARLAAREVTSG